jgi:hypothetical protein
MGIFNVVKKIRSFGPADIVKVVNNDQWPKHFIPVGTLCVVYKTALDETSVVYNQKIQVVSNSSIRKATAEETF